MTADQRAAQQQKIEACSAEMAASRTYDQFEAALSKAHQLGASPYGGDVSLVAYADVVFAD